MAHDAAQAIDAARALAEEGNNGSAASSQAGGNASDGGGADHARGNDDDASRRRARDGDGSAQKVSGEVASAKRTDPPCSMPCSPCAAHPPTAMGCTSDERKPRAEEQPQAKRPRIGSRSDGSGD